MLRADFFGDGFLNLGKGRGDVAGSAQVELHAADVGFVGDGLRVQLEDDGVTDLRGFGHRCFGGFGELGADRGNAVGGEQLFRFVLGEDGAAAGADLLHDASGNVALGIEDGARARGGGFIEVAQIGLVCFQVATKASAAASGYGKDGNAGAGENGSPSATKSPPIQLAMTGLPVSSRRARDARRPRWDRSCPGE